MVRLVDRQKDRQRQQQDAQRIEDHAQQAKDHGRAKNQHHIAGPQVNHQVRHRCGNTADRQKPRKQVGTDRNDEDRRGHFRSVHQRDSGNFPVQGAARRRNREGQRRPDSPGLRGCEYPGEQTAENAHHQQEHGPCLAQGLQPFGPCRAFVVRRRERGIDPRTNDDHGPVPQHCQHARHDRGQKQLADRDLGKNTVDDQKDARRDERPHGAGCGNHGGTQPGIVVALQHFRHRDPAHCRGAGQAGAGRRRKQRRAAHAGDRQPARQE